MGVVALKTMAGRAWSRWGPGQPESVTPPAPAPVIVEHGSFAHGYCGACGWEGPGRRARGTARSDHDLHLLVCGLSPEFARLIETTASLPEQSRPMADR